MDMSNIQGLLTAIAALVAAGVGVWNAFQALRNKTQLEEVKKSLARHGYSREARKTRRK